MMKKILLVLLGLFVAGSATAAYLSIAYPVSGPAQDAARTGGSVSDTASGSATASADTGGYTTSEVAAHSSASDCWLIIRNSVYDVTSYIPQHPGGRRNITNVCGRETSSIFAAIHSNRAWDLLGRYKIGALATGPANAPVSATNSASQADADGAISAAVSAAVPGSTVLSVHPFGNGYTALLSVENKLIDVVTDADGAVMSQSTRRDELEWFWESDDDEIREWHESEHEDRDEHEDGEREYEDD